MPETISKSKIERDKKQQDRLNSKLNERLEYSGVYFQRNPQEFFQNTSSFKQQQSIAKLKRIYAQILDDYFSSEDNTNRLIDRFVEAAFLINLPMNQVVEIHRSLIDTLERQLQLEGLHIEYLSDFRLTLIDVIAHLGEMYRSVICEQCLDDD